MRGYFFRCERCALPHEAGTRVCPVDGVALEHAPLGSPTRALDAADDDAAELEPLRTVPDAHAAGEAAPAATSSDAGGLDAPARAGRAAVTGDAPEGDRAAGTHAGQVLGGRYRVLRRIGEGGMGVVYEAEHLELGHAVAIKVLARRYLDDPVANARFHREARVAGGLGHPNVVAVFDLGALDDGTPFLAMELLRGETLGRRMRRERGLPVDDALAVLRQLLSGLHATHARGVVHRDLNPENVFLCESEGREGAVRAKILDFGISKQHPVGDDDTLSSLTRAGTALGTPGYMAPEQVTGERDIDARADLFAVGALGFEMLTGAPPFRAQKFYDLLVAMRTPPSARALRPAVPEELDALVRALLAPLRDERPSSARAALERLERAARAASAP